MAKHIFAEFPNLLLSDQVYGFIASSHKNMDEDAKRKMFERMNHLNEIGFSGGGHKVYEKTKRYDLWEVKWKGKNRTEWRFLVKRIPGTDKYFISYAFLKKSEAIKERDFKTAIKITKNEGF